MLPPTCYILRLLDSMHTSTQCLGEEALFMALQKTLGWRISLSQPEGFPWGRASRDKVHLLGPTK